MARTPNDGYRSAMATYTKPGAEGFFRVGVRTAFLMEKQ